MNVTRDTIVFDITAGNRHRRINMSNLPIRDFQSKGIFKVMYNQLVIDGSHVCVQFSGGTTHYDDEHCWGVKV